MKKRRTRQEQASAVARVRSAVALQQFRPGVVEDRKTYKRAEQKRHWQKDQEALFVCPPMERSAVPAV